MKYYFNIFSIVRLQFQLIAVFLDPELKLLDPA